MPDTNALTVATTQVQQEQTKNKKNDAETFVSQMQAIMISRLQEVMRCNLGM